jgi:hypothetical protein
MFLQTDALEIRTVIPDGNTGADRWSAHAGFREVFHRDRCFDLMGGLVGASYRVLDYESWVNLDPANRKSGHELARSLRLLGALVPDEPIYDAWSGATINAIEHGNVVKAVALFNRWACHARFDAITPRTLNPLVLDMAGCMLQYDADGLHLLSHPARSASALDEDIVCPSSLPQQPSPPPLA